MIHVIAIITAHAGQRDRLLEAVRDNTPAVQAEEGCIEYAAAIDVREPASAWAAFGPDTLLIIEKWASREALKAHAASPHMAAYAARTKELVASRAIHVLEPALRD